MLAAVVMDYIRLCNRMEALEQQVVVTAERDSGSTGGRDKATQDVSRLVSEAGSSVWCWGTSPEDRMCRFRNLCYLPAAGGFVFFHANSSLHQGVPGDRFSPTLLELSSVRQHNAQYFNFLDLPAASARHLLRGAALVVRTSLLMNRFHPGNLMHVLHDDLLPMYAALVMIAGRDPATLNVATGRRTSEPFDVQVVFAEGWQPGEFADLYELFSSHSPIYRSQLSPLDRALCFADVFVGLPKDTVWYQYGFHQPQGPVPDASINGLLIRQFTEYVESRLMLNAEDNVQCLSSLPEKYGVLLTRKHNRLILNEMDLALELASKLNMRVLTVAFETHSVAEMIAFVRKSSLLIGMHGSLFALAMFLPPGALIVELFPYAVNPDHYTPYRTLAELPGMSLTYRCWRNMEEANTRTHPDAPWELGGISHLPLSEQEGIKSSVEVPQHLCCRDPSWLFRIYQDTVVNLDEVIALIEEGLKGTSGRKNHYLEADFVINSNIYPHFVQELVCHPQTDPSEQEREQSQSKGTATRGHVVGTMESRSHLVEHGTVRGLVTGGGQRGLHCLDR